MKLKALIFTLVFSLCLFVGAYAQVTSPWSSQNNPGGPGSPMTKSVNNLDKAYRAWYPHNRGTMWTYEMSTSVDGGRNKFLDVTYKVTGRKTIDGQECIIIDGFPGGSFVGKDRIVVGKDFVSLHSRVMNNGGMTYTFNPPRPRMKFPLKVGKEWKWNGTINGMTYNCNFKVAGKQKVTVPAGTFTALRIDLSIEGPGGSRTEASEWYVPKVGMVRSEQSSKRGNSTFTMVRNLKSYSIR